MAISAVAVFLPPSYGAPKPEETQTEPQQHEKPLVVAPQTLAQAVHDDVNAAASKYHLTMLQLTGVVTKVSEYKGEVHLFQFDLKVKDAKSGKMDDFTIFFGLKDAVPKGDKRLEELAVGKKVTVRGKSTSMGNGQVTLYKCVIVPTDDKAESTKGKTAP